MPGIVIICCSVWFDAQALVFLSMEVLPPKCLWFLRGEYSDGHKLIMKDLVPIINNLYTLKLHEFPANNSTGEGRLDNVVSKWSSANKILRIVGLLTVLTCATLTLRWSKLQSFSTILYVSFSMQYNHNSSEFNQSLFDVHTLTTILWMS